MQLANADSFHKYFEHPLTLGWGEGGSGHAFVLPRHSCMWAVDNFTSPDAAQWPRSPPLGAMSATELRQGTPTMSTAGPVPPSSTISGSTVAPISLPTVTSMSSLTVVSPYAARGAGHSGAVEICNLLSTVGQSKKLSLSAGIYVGEAPASPS